MSVSVPNRSESTAEFVYIPYTTLLQCMMDTANAPKKHKELSAKRLFDACYDMLDCATEAQSIYLTKDLPVAIHDQRRLWLIQARGAANVISVMANLYFDMLANTRAMSVEDAEKKKLYYAEQTDKEIKLLNGLLKHDWELYPNKNNG